MFLTRIHIFCFVASYVVALLLEASRLFFRVPVRLAVTAAFTAAGLFAHVVFIALRGTANPRQAPPLSGWFDWLLMLAAGVALFYLVTMLRRPQTALGIFLLPLVLLLIGMASRFRDAVPFPRSEAVRVWGMLHGVSLLAGTIVVTLGLVAGVMYLLQSYRLKHKLPPRPGLKLPSLEWLQQANRHTLGTSSLLLTVGLLAGGVLNVVLRDAALPWTDPVIWMSGILLAWIVAVSGFEWCYKPAQQGRKVAYLTLASFVFLALTLAIVLWGPSRHATGQAPYPVDAAATPADEGEADR